MPTPEEQKELDDKAAAEKADADAAEATLKEIDDLVEKGEAVKEDGFVKVKKSQLHKISSDKSNYRKATLKDKAEERKLQEDKGKEGQGAGAMDEKKIQETATSATNKVLREAAEKTAKRKFFKDHPEYLEDNAWKELLPSLRFDGSEVTHEDVLDRLEGAVLEHKRKTGKLDEYMESERKRAREQGRIEGQIEGGREFGGTGDRNDSKGQSQLSDKGQEMARAFRIDPEKVKKVDPSKDNEIDIFNKQKK